MVLVLMSVYVSYAFGIMFGICEIGQRITDKFDEMDEEIGAFNWYLFPHKIQKILTIILIKTQTPIELKCFGSFSTTRENSAKVSFYS